MDEHWETWDIESGPVHYAEISADLDVQKIVLKAQANLTKEGYWQDVAAGLADLVDTLKARLEQVGRERDEALARAERLQATLDGLEGMGEQLLMVE